MPVASLSWALPPSRRSFVLAAHSAFSSYSPSSPRLTPLFSSSSPRVSYAPHQGPYTSDQFPCSHLGPSRDPGQPLANARSLFHLLGSVFSSLSSLFFAFGLFQGESSAEKLQKWSTRNEGHERVAPTSDDNNQRGVSFDRPTQNIAAARYP